MEMDNIEGKKLEDIEEENSEDDEDDEASLVQMLDEIKMLEVENAQIEEHITELNTKAHQQKDEIYKLYTKIKSDKEKEALLREQIKSLDESIAAKETTYEALVQVYDQKLADYNQFQKEMTEAKNMADKSYAETKARYEQLPLAKKVRAQEIEMRKEEIQLAIMKQRVAEQETKNKQIGEIRRKINQIEIIRFAEMMMKYSKMMKDKALIEQYEKEFKAVKEKNKENETIEKYRKTPPREEYQSIPIDVRSFELPPLTPMSCSDYDFKMETESVRSEYSEASSLGIRNEDILKKYSETTSIALESRETFKRSFNKSVFEDLKDTYGKDTNKKPQVSKSEFRLPETNHLQTTEKMLETLKIKEEFKKSTKSYDTKDSLKEKNNRFDLNPPLTPKKRDFDKSTFAEIKEPLPKIKKTQENNDNKENIQLIAIQRNNDISKRDVLKPISALDNQNKQSTNENIVKSERKEMENDDSYDIKLEPNEKLKQKLKSSYFDPMSSFETTNQFSDSENDVSMKSETKELASTSQLSSMQLTGMNMTEVGSLYSGFDLNSLLNKASSVGSSDMSGKYKMTLDDISDDIQLESPSPSGVAFNLFGDDKNSNKKKDDFFFSFQKNHTNKKSDNFFNF